MWGADGTGWNAESVVEVIVRSASGKRTVEQSLEGWRKGGVCKLEELEELTDIWSRNSTSVSRFWHYVSSREYEIIVTCSFH